jgi:uncharacterized protein (UPF0248 family)
MMPIRELLDRIRWDHDFGRGRFEIGYEDHSAQGILRIPFEKMKFTEGNHFSFQLEDAEGEIKTIPFHRVREVYKQGHLVWRRPSSHPPSSA